MGEVGFKGKTNSMYSYIIRIYHIQTYSHSMCPTGKKRATDHWMPCPPTHVLWHSNIIQPNLVRSCDRSLHLRVLCFTLFNLWFNILHKVIYKHWPRPCEEGNACRLATQDTMESIHYAGECTCEIHFICMCVCACVCACLRACVRVCVFVCSSVYML